MVKSKENKAPKSSKQSAKINKKNEVKQILKEYPRSYRIDSELMDVLKNTLNRINKMTPKKVSEARLIKALILISKEIEDEKIIKALKEVW